MNKPSEKNLVFFIYLILAIGTAVCFWQVRNFDFTNYDDNLYITENQHVLGGLTYDGLIWAFTTGYACYWHPLTWLSFMLDCQLFGPNPGWIHLVSLLLHIANTLLLFAILKKMTSSLWPSAFVAALFALHPMHVESVAWIAERKDLLSTLFLFLTVAAYISYIKRSSLFRYMLTLVLFAFGLLAKPMLVTLPFVLLLLDYWPLNRFAFQITKVSGCKFSKSAPPYCKRQILYQILIEKIPFFVLSGISSVITFSVVRSGGIINVNPLSDRVTNALLSYPIYIGKMFWPQNLAVIYPLCTDNFTLWLIIVCSSLLLVISVFVISFGRKCPYLPVGWFWFIGTLVPTIGLVQVGLQAYADRYTYISYIGLFIMIAWGLPQLIAKWPHRKIALGVAMAVILVSLGIAAHRQTSYWKNGSTLFSHAIEVTRNNYVAHSCLAQEAYLQGDIALTIEHCTKALQINPNYADAVLGLGCALADQGDIAQAIGYFQKTLQLRPDCADAHNYLGVALQKQGRFAEAFAHFAQSVELEPESASPRNNLAKALVLRGRLEEAVEQFRETIRLKPDWLSPINDLAWLIATKPELKKRDINEAIRFASRVCEMTNYKNPTPLDTLAAAYASAGNFSQAVETAQKALNLVDPNNKEMFKAIQSHLDLYKASKSYIEAPQKTGIGK